MRSKKNQAAIKQYSVWRSRIQNSTTRCLMIIKKNLSFKKRSKNNNIILQLGTTLSNEASVLGGFLSDF